MNRYADKAMNVDENDVTRSLSGDELIAGTLSAIVALLKAMPETPKVRELRTRAITYRRSVEKQQMVRPSSAQRNALRDLVSDLHAKTLDLAVTTQDESALPSPKPLRRGH